MNLSGNEIQNKDVFKLKFPSDLENEFRQNLLQKTLWQVRLAFISVIIVFLFFAYVDTLVTPQTAKSFILIRIGIVIPIFLLTYLLTYTKFYYKYANTLLALNVFIAGLSMIYFLSLQPQNYTYYSAIILVLCCGYFMVRMRFVYSLITGTLIIAVFNYVFSSNNLLPRPEMISLNGLYLTGNFIGIFASYFYELYSRINFFQEKQIKQKTSELKKNEIIYSSTFDQATIAFMHLSDDLKIIRLNNAFKEMFDKNCQLDKNWYNMEACMNTELEILVFDQIKNREIESIEKDFEYKKENRSSWHKINISGVFNPEGDFLFYSVFIYNISDIKIAESQLKDQLKKIELTNKLMVDREMRIIEMKKEVNSLCRKLNIDERYEEIVK